MLLGFSLSPSTVKVLKSNPQPIGFYFDRPTARGIPSPVVIEPLASLSFSQPTRSAMISFVPAFAATFDLVFQAVYMGLSNLQGFADEVVAARMFHRLCLIWFIFICGDRGTVSGISLQVPPHLKVLAQGFLSDGIRLHPFFLQGRHYGSRSFCGIFRSKQGCKFPQVAPASK